MTDDDQERKESLKITIALSALVIVAAAVILWGVTQLVPAVSIVAQESFSPGLGLKDAAMVSLVVSFVIILVMAIFAGDGLIGEIQFMILGFFVFFLFFWLCLAWLF